MKLAHYRIVRKGRIFVIQRKYDFTLFGKVWWSRWTQLDWEYSFSVAELTLDQIMDERKPNSSPLVEREQWEE